MKRKLAKNENGKEALYKCPVPGTRDPLIEGLPVERAELLRCWMIERKYDKVLKDTKCSLEALRTVTLELFADGCRGVPAGKLPNFNTRKRAVFLPTLIEFLDSGLEHGEKQTIKKSAHMAGLIARYTDIRPLIPGLSKLLYSKESAEWGMSALFEAVDKRVNNPDALASLGKAFSDQDCQSRLEIGRGLEYAILAGANVNRIVLPLAETMNERKEGEDVDRLLASSTDVAEYASHLLALAAAKGARISRAAQFCVIMDAMSFGKNRGKNEFVLALSSKKTGDRETAVKSAARAFLSEDSEHFPYTDCLKKAAQHGNDRAKKTITEIIGACISSSHMVQGAADNSWLFENRLSIFAGIMEKMRDTSGADGQ